MASGITVSRDINVQGLGANSRSGAILSSGDNTLSGLVATAGGATARATRIISQAGTLNFSGNLNVGSAFNTIVTSLGGTNQTGSGSYTITGALSGTGILEKTGSGTLLLEPASTAGFGGRVRIGSSATGQQSTVRVTTNSRWCFGFRYIQCCDKPGAGSLYDEWSFGDSKRWQFSVWQECSTCKTLQPFLSAWCWRFRGEW